MKKGEIMKNNLEKIKDILYNISDYLIMATIVIAIGLIIGWRLDVLFPQTTAMMNPDSISKVEKEIAEKKEKSDSETIVDSSIKENPIKAPLQTRPVTPEIIHVSIPSGTHSTGIGEILLAKGLVSSTKEFEEKVIELNLEKSLRSGEFDISKDAQLETVVRIIANKK